MKYSDRLAEDLVTIFLFHGVIEKQRHTVRNYTRKHIEKDYFQEVLRDLKKTGTPVSMDDLIHHILERKPFPRFAFAITFDDGFENNFSIAAPILKNMTIPATFYLTTDFIENNHMSWIDRIELCFENCPRGCLKLPWNGQERVFKSREDKIAILDELRYHINQDQHIDLDELVCDIFSQCNISKVTQCDGPLDLKMSWKQVKQLQQEPGFTVGGHSHRHRILSFLNQQELSNEISISLQLLKDKADVESRHYSYPEGMAHCYSEQVIEVLKTYGVKCCPTAEDGINSMSQSLFHLKRVMVT